ncbi:MAG: hypothetical protein K6346_08600 [Halothiobacillaceae bacterium]
MEDLRWILLVLGALVFLGLYLFIRKRRGDARLPLGDELQHDPLEAAPEPRRTEPFIEDITYWDKDEVGPVRRRPLDEEGVPPPRPGQRRPTRFSYETKPRTAPNAGQAPQTNAPAAKPSPTLSVQDRPVREQPVAENLEKPLQEDGVQTPPPVVVSIYIIARDPQGFAGATLLKVFAHHGFEFGEMDVYHHADTHGHILFSLMNGVAPGTFDPVTLSKQHTPALALFLRLPIQSSQPTLVFEQFLDVAHRLAGELDATLLDERREELSTESIDRMREIALGE